MWNIVFFKWPVDKKKFTSYLPESAMPLSLEDGRKLHQLVHACEAPALPKLQLQLSRALVLPVATPNTGLNWKLDNFEQTSLGVVSTAAAAAADDDDDDDAATAVLQTHNRRNRET